MGRPSNTEVAAKVKELNRQQMAFVVWSATPADLREPRSKKELGEVIGVSQQSLWRWEKDPRVLDAIRFVVLQNAGEPGKVSMILDMLHAKALADKDREAAKVWLQATGVMSAFGRQNSVLDALDADADFDIADFSLEQLEAFRDEQVAAQSERDAVVAAKRLLAEGDLNRG